MADEFKKGDKVVWSSHGKDDTPGVVQRKITSDTEAGGRKVKASKEEPQYLESRRREAAGAKAGRRPGGR